MCRDLKTIRKVETVTRVIQSVDTNDSTTTFVVSGSEVNVGEHYHSIWTELD